MSGDTLIEMLAIVRATAPDLPADRLNAIEAAIRESHGGRDNYIARRAKRTHLETLERAAAVDMDLTAQQLAQMLGVSVRHAKRLKRLRR